MQNKIQNTESNQRIETFVDAVFAIAITLLILDVKVPTHQQLESQTLSCYLSHNWTNYASYILSFFIIGIYWANHHKISKLYISADRTFIILHIIFLLTICFLPYPTAILGDFFMDEKHRQTATSFYTAGLLAPACMWFIIWLYSSNNHKLIPKSITNSYIKKLNKQFLITNIIYILSFILSFFQPTIALSISLLTTLYYLFELNYTKQENTNLKRI
jgi:uncharacterized membrane protein